MKVLTKTTLLAGNIFYTIGLTPTCRLTYQKLLFTAPSCQHSKIQSFTCLLYASQNEDESASLSPADNLLKMVEEISNDQFSPEVIAKMQELEQALTSFLGEQGKEKYQQKWSPRPPGTPPPLRVLQNLDTQQASLVKAEMALEKLRDRLLREEEALRRAEEALQQSLHEEEILRRAEEALQRSREAAEKRKLEAIRQTEAAVASAEKARRDSEEAAQAWGRQQATTPLPVVQEKVDDRDDTDVAYYRGSEAPRSTIALNFLVGTKATTLKITNAQDGDPGSDAEAPIGIPVLSNWVQYIDGSIQGQVRNSDKFEDGAVIATSAVQPGVKAGTIIETSSGSQYYLEMPPGKFELIEDDTPTGYDGDKSNQYSVAKAAESQPRMAKAPDGVPSIMSWKILQNGGVAGLIYGSWNAEDGDYIETSPIKSGTLESGQVVTTQSGSRYFLSPDEKEKAANSLAAFQDLVEARGGSTITITKNHASQNGYPQESVDASNNKNVSTLRVNKPRPTFSLFDIFGKSDSKVSGKTGGETGPGGVPMLTNWNANPDGTVTGIVSGSPHLNDGDMVTTSPIVSGALTRYETVITETGSTYYLA